MLAAAAAFRLIALDREGSGNLYYAAAVRSMLTSWHAFVFASYDPGGFVTVDKPPLGLWIQAAFAQILGFAGTSLLLPQVLAGIASVGLLFHLVGRHFGTVAGLVAALALAATPITVATDRSNNADSLIALTSLLAAWAVLRACERASLRWLLGAAVIVGLGFNIKMLQAYMVLPALAITYLVCARTTWPRRIAHLGAAAVVTIVVSAPWVVFVDLTPAEARPYVGGSRDNTVRDLITGHNGLARLGLFRIGPAPGPRPGPGGPPGAAPGAPIGPPPPGSAGGPPSPLGGPFDESGEPGILRLFNAQLGGQIAWLLPLAMIGAAAAAPVIRGGGAPAASALLWIVWLVSVGAFFSLTAGIFHRYYLSTLAPAVAALAAIAVARLWSRPALLGAALLLTAGVQALIASRHLAAEPALIPALLWGTAIAAAVLALPWVAPRAHLAAAALGVLALLAGPLVWSSYPLRGASGAMLPAAGPPSFGAPGPAGPRGGPPPGPSPTAAGASFGADPGLVSFLLAHATEARFLAATPSQMTASPLILATARPVMAWRGFNLDRILDPAGFAARVRDGTVRYVVLDSSAALPGSSASARASAPDDIGRWVIASCSLVAPENWRSDPRRSPASQGPLPRGPIGQLSLYDCGTARTR